MKIQPVTYLSHEELLAWLSRLLMSETSPSQRLSLNCM